MIPGVNTGARVNRVFRNGCVLCASLASLLAACQTTRPSETLHAIQISQTAPPLASESPHKAVAKVQIYLTSQCQYGVQAENVVLLVLEQFGSQVDLDIEYLGTIRPDGRLDSLHGDAEVSGDLAQICAARVAPNSYRKFIVCANEDWRNTPNNVNACAKETGIDLAAFAECRNGELGRRLLAASFERSSSAHVQGSPTIKIDGIEYEGRRTPREFAQALCDTIAESSKPEVCKTLPKPPEIRMTVITDKRCKKCETERLIASVAEVLIGLQPRVLDWSDPQARTIALDAKVDRLPAVLFDDTLNLDAEGAARLARYLKAAGSYRALRVDANFDPTAEICDNRVDDTADGKVDCADPACHDNLACRPETKGTLALFVMSQCPYATIGLNSMKPVLSAFGREMKFRIHFIGDPIGNSIVSLHGNDEVQEDLREICAIAHYPRNNKFMDYIWCRNEDIRNNDWKKCATGVISPEVIQACSTGAEGRRLLREDMKMAQSLGLGASPTWLANNRVSFEALSAAEIQKVFCEQNPQFKGCHTTFSQEYTPDSQNANCRGR